MTKPTKLVKLWRILLSAFLQSMTITNVKLE